jgi:transaldolase
MPRATLEAFADHGRRVGDTITGSYDDALRFLGELKAAGIDLDDVTDQLEREGLAKFEASWAELTATVAAELDRNHPGAGSTPR